ncbi:MAG: beta-lactamase family protein [Pseudomonadota bacterium]|nr:beta-lactamase family protein [Pseudomonadota bacterium]
MRLAITAFAALLATSALAKPVETPRHPVGADTLFWSQVQKEMGFPHMERQFSVHTVKRGAHVHPLPKGQPLTVAAPLDGKPSTVDAYMLANHTAGILVVQNGKVRMEKYGLGYSPKGRWTSFSVAKSFTSTLVGAAIKDGYIKSIDDPVTRYIPGLKGSAYDGVSVKQLLTMTSGVKWNEDYTDPKSDVAQLFSEVPAAGVDATVSYMRKLPREAEPGAKWVYKTGETNLIGVLVTSATHKTLANYLSEKIWKPFGMEQDAVWMVDDRGQEAGGCCISVALHDYARMGEFILGGGKVHGRSILPDGWIQAATHKQVETGEPGGGYGYQWWTRDDGSVDARGIFGQMIHIDPKRHLVIAISSAWEHATDRKQSQDRNALIAAVSAAVDAEAKPGR